MGPQSNFRGKKTCYIELRVFRRRVGKIITARFSRLYFFEIILTVCVCVCVCVLRRRVGKDETTAETAPILQ